MSLDFRKTTYRPNRPQTRLGTSYGRMSQWMAVLTNGQNVIKRPDYPAYVYIQNPVHLQYCSETGYDDFHKAYRHKDKQLPNLAYPVFGPPRLRQGRAGASWRHVKEVMQARGGRTLFVDGQVRLEDNNRLIEVPGGNMLQPRVQSRHQQPEDSGHVTHTDRLLPDYSRANTFHGYSPESTMAMDYDTQYNPDRMTQRDRYYP